MADNGMGAGAPGGPMPHGALSSARQLRWHELEVYGFLHFTVNTFTDREWGYGDESPEVFNPTDFDADQIAATLAAGGLKAVILTCKHHDGFCLWPSRYTEHSVKASPWRGGRGDAVREMSEACARHGLGFGVYLSPWDRNHAAYATAEYVRYFQNQLRELLEGYGPLFEVWFDGANGGDGYYGGARETRSIDAGVYYEWDRTFGIVRELQPDACIFGDPSVGADVRWVGNERGIAGDPCWATITPGAAADAESGIRQLNTGTRDGAVWMPAECDVSIRPGWFYHAAEDGQVKTPDALMELYFQSVGRGASLLLNLPPDRRGRIPEGDAASLAAFGRRVRHVFGEGLKRPTAIQASHTRGDDRRFAPENVCDGLRHTFWSPQDDQRQAELELTFDEPVRVDAVSLREHLPLGQRIDRYAVDVRDGDRWREVAAGEAIGARRIATFAPAETTGVRVRIVDARACPALADVQVGERG